MEQFHALRSRPPQAEVSAMKALLLVAVIAVEASAQPRTYIRVNQLGYLPSGPKVAIACSLETTSIKSFTVQDDNGRLVFGPAKARSSGAFGPCVSTHRLDFTTLRRPGHYTIVAGGAASPRVRIDSRAYAGAADTLLYYMRGQRSGFNPIVRDSVHKHDGIIVDHPTRTGQFISVSGGWAIAITPLHSPTNSMRADYRDPMESPTFSTRPGMDSTGSFACIPMIRRCSTRSPTIATTHTGICPGPILRTTDGEKEKRDPFIPAPASRRESSSRRTRTGRTDSHQPRESMRLRSESERRSTAHQIQTSRDCSRRKPGQPSDLACSTKASVRPHLAAHPTSTRRTTGATTWSSAQHHSLMPPARSTTSAPVWSTHAMSRSLHGWERTPLVITSGIPGTTTDTMSCGATDHLPSARRWRDSIAEGWKRWCRAPVMDFASAFPSSGAPTTSWPASPRRPICIER